MKRFVVFILSLILLVGFLAFTGCNKTPPSPPAESGGGGGNEQPPILTYSITYVLNGGSVNGTNPTEYNEETDTFTLINPEKSDCEFIGWTGTGLTELTLQVVIEKGSTGDREYTANWQITDPDLPILT